MSTIFLQYVLRMKRARRFRVTADLAMYVIPRLWPFPFRQWEVARANSARFDCPDKMHAFRLSQSKPPLFPCLDKLAHMHWKSYSGVNSTRKKANPRKRVRLARNFQHTA